MKESGVKEAGEDEDEDEESDETIKRTRPLKARVNGVNANELTCRRT